MKKVKRNIIIAAVLLFVCAAVYLNWSYNNSWGAADPAMVKAEDEKMTSLIRTAKRSLPPTTSPRRG